MLDNLVHVSWYLFHSCVQCRKFKMQNRTCSCDQKAQRFCPLFPDIIQFLTWVINVFKPPVTTPLANFRIVENIPVLILHIMPNILKFLSHSPFFLFTSLVWVKTQQYSFHSCLVQHLSPVSLVSALGYPDCSTLLPLAHKSATVVTCLIGIKTVCHLYCTACWLHKQNQQVALCL